MFTIQQIKAIHAKVKSGADFPAYIHELKELGILSYRHNVCNGETVYHGVNGFTISSGPKYGPFVVAAENNKTMLTEALIIHQQGGTDYLTFCHEAAMAGIDYWAIDMPAMTCTYYDHHDQALVQEHIPQV